MGRARSCRPVELPSGRAARRGLSRCGAQRLWGREAARFTLRRQPPNGWRGGASPERTDPPGRAGRVCAVASPSAMAPPRAAPEWPALLACAARLEGLRARNQRTRGAATASRALEAIGGLRGRGRASAFETSTSATPAEGPQGPYIVSGLLPRRDRSQKEEQINLLIKPRGLYNRSQPLGRKDDRRS